MNEGIGALKWLSEQGDRVWFLAAISVLVWTFVKQQKRADVIADRKDAVLEACNRQLLANSEHVAQVCGEACQALENNTEMLRRIEKKL